MQIEKHAANAGPGGKIGDPEARSGLPITDTHQLSSLFRIGGVLRLMFFEEFAEGLAFFRRGVAEKSLLEGEPQSLSLIHI